MPDLVFPVVWLLLAAWFAVWETIAVRRPRPGDTLSENLRGLLLAPRWWRRVSLAGWGVFVAWFTVHIWG